jgi:Holliday junction resolvase RusA-like endonuclease
MKGTYTPKATKLAEAELRLLWCSEHGTDMSRYKGAVKLVVCTFRRLPKGTPKKVVRKPDMQMPDLDNIVKLASDALNGLAWEDDRQIVSIEAHKMPRTHKAADKMSVAVHYLDLD